MSTFMSTICCFLPDDPRDHRARRSKWSSPDEDSGRGSSHRVQTGQPERAPLIPSASHPPSIKNQGVKNVQYHNLPSLDSISCSGYQTFTCRSSDGSSEATDDADDECSVDVNHLFKKGNLMAGPSKDLTAINEAGSPPPQPQPEVSLTTSYDEFYHTLTVTIKNCRNLVFTDRPIINPFVQVYLLPDSSKRRMRRSKICFNSNNPDFDQHLLPFDLSPNQIDKHKLKVCIYHSNAIATPPSPLKTNGSSLPGQAKLDVEARKTIMIQKWQSQFRTRSDSTDEILLAQTTIPLSQYMLRKSLTRSYTLTPVLSPNAILDQLINVSKQPAITAPGYSILTGRLPTAPMAVKTAKNSKSSKVNKLNSFGKLHLDLRFVLKETSQNKPSPNQGRKRSGHTGSNINPRALGTLEIKIVSAEGLPLRDVDDLADNEGIEPRAYCKVFLYSNNDSLTPTSNKTNGKAGLRHGLKQRTPTCEKATTDPTWNYLISYHNLTLELLADVCIEISVWDSRDRRKNTFVGGIRLSSVNIVNENPHNSMATNLNELAQQHSFDSRRDNYFDCHEEERNLWLKFLSSCKNPSYNRFKNHNFIQSTLGLRTFTPFDSFRSSFGLCFYESC